MSRHYITPVPRVRNVIRPEISRRALARQEKYQTNRSVRHEKDSIEIPARYLNIPGVTPELYSDISGEIDVKTVGKIGAVATAAALILYVIAGGGLIKSDGDEKKNPDNSGNNSTYSSKPTKISWSVGNGDDMRPLDDVDKDTKEGKVVLKFQHKVKSTGKVVEHKAILNNDKGVYRQSEEWSGEGDPVSWEDVAYAGVPWLFEKPTMDGNPKEWLNAIDGEVSLENGIPVIRNITKITLYDGQISKLGQQTSIKGIVRSIEDKSAGAKLVHVIDATKGVDYEQLLYFSGNRLYKANGLQTANQLDISIGDRITADVRPVDEWGQLMPDNEKVDGALAVFEYRKN